MLRFSGRGVSQCVENRHSACPHSPYTQFIQPSHTHRLASLGAKILQLVLSKHLLTKQVPPRGQDEVWEAEW